MRSVSLIVRKIYNAHRSVGRGQAALQTSILKTILRNTGKDIWDSMNMCKKYQGFIKVKTQGSILRALCKELDVLSMKIGEFVDEYFARTL